MTDEYIKIHEDKKIKVCSKCGNPIEFYKCLDINIFGRDEYFDLFTIEIKQVSNLYFYCCKKCKYVNFKKY